MNDWDRDNLNFILSLNEDEFETWLVYLSEDDQLYALELIRAKRLELLEQEDELLNELAEEDLTLANQVLAKFRL